MKACIMLVAVLLAVGCTEYPRPTRFAKTPPRPEVDRPLPERAQKVLNYSPSDQCKGCHVDIYSQQMQSMHARSYINPVFQAQYYGEALPRARQGPKFFYEAITCAACHMPVAHQNNARDMVFREHVDPQMSGVTCDLCHRIAGFTGTVPENGNFIASPGDEKYGPFRHSYSWHHVYLEFQTQSEFCAVCHESTNQLGVHVKPTYTEWKTSQYAADGVQCQDCHMNASGYLIDKQAVYDSGKAATMTLGSAPERGKLYSHQFPGARTQTQLEDAIPLHLSTGKDTAEQGEQLTITVRVDNERTGHRMPSGSIELRYVWLELEARSGDRRIAIPAVSATDPPGYDVGGALPADRAVLGKAFPRGMRVYRAVFLDAQGNQTQSMIDAAKKVFDNRLDTAAVRTERYRWRVPPDIHGKVKLVARLNYVAYPQAFATRFNLPPAPTTLISDGQCTLTVTPSR